jgi:hypothetical protein
MKKPEISFRIIGDSGPLSIYWHPGPYGNAIEAKKGNGVFWLAPNGELLGVEFDDVSKISDHQVLTLKNNLVVEVFIRKGAISYKLNAGKGIDKTG